MKLLHSTRFTFPERPLWFGRARLYENRIELSGWNLSGRYRRTIPLSQVERVEWWTMADDTNFALYLEDGSTVALQLRQAAGTWKFKIDTLLGRSTLQEAALPDESPTRDAAA